MSFTTWRISRKLMAAFGIIIVSFAAVAMIVMLNMEYIYKETS